MRNKVFRLSGVLSLVLTSQAFSGIEWGVNGGMTYRPGYNNGSYDMSGGIGFPVAGLTAYSKGKGVSLKSYLEYSKFKLTYPAPYNSDATQKVYMWSTFLLTSFMGLQMGVGGGVGYEKTFYGSVLGHSYAGISLNYEIAQNLSIDTRTLVEVGGIEIWKRWVTLVTVNFLIFPSN